jgi:recombination protein RecA
MARKKSPSTQTVSSSRIHSLAEALSEKHEKGRIRTGGVRLTIPGIISTRCPTLDAAIGRGGIPLGRFSILTGDEGTGKTTLALQMVAETQKLGGVVFYGDTENKLDLLYARALGVDVDEMIVGNPKHVEDAFDMLSDVVKTIRDANIDTDVQIPGLVVLDSLNTTIPTVEYDAEFTDRARPGGHAASFSRAIAKLNNMIGATPVAILFISQIRQVIKTMPGHGPQTNEIAGGRAPAFIAALVIRLIRMGLLKEGSNGPVYGQEIKAIIRKSQISMPFREAIFRINFGEGVDYNHGILTLGVAMGVLNLGSGGWYEIPDFAEGRPLKWQGEKGFSKRLSEQPGLLQIIERRIGERGSSVPRSTVKAAAAASDEDSADEE